MRWWHALKARIRSIVRRGQREADLREELGLHIDREVERLQATGLTARAARQQALRAFGGVAAIEDRCRDERGTGVLDALWRDTRHGVRRLVRDWRFTAAAVLVLGLGIGANTAIFSLVNAALFRQSSIADSDRLVDIYQNGSNPGGIDANSYQAYLDMAVYTDVFSSTTAVFVPRGVSYLDEGTLRSAVVEHTTSTYPDVLGLQPWLGRWFAAADDQPGAPVVGVVGYDAWKRKFRADPSIIGREIRIDGVPVTIVGVGPAGHRGTVNLGIVTDFWLPISPLPALGASPRTLDRRPDEAAFFVKARLQPGVTVAQARAAMDVLGARLASDHPDEDPGKGISVFASRDVRIHPQMDGVLASVAAVLVAIVGLVLAIACSNIATLLLVRGSARAKEVSLRLALGATRRQVVGHLLTESVLLALAGGVAGCILAWWSIRWLGTLELPVMVDVSLDYRVLAFATVVSLATGIVFGLAPALRSTRVDLVPTLRGDGEVRFADRRWFTLKNALVVFQVAVSAVLLGGTSLFLQLLDEAQTARVGFAVDGIAMLETDARYAGLDAAVSASMHDEIRRRVEAIPGVSTAVLTHGLPMQPDGVRVIAEGMSAGVEAEKSGSVAGAIWAGPGYFDLLGIPILHGRALDERDRADAPRAAVVSESMARQHFGTDNAADAVGRRFRLEGDAAAGEGWIEVVGVARDAGTADLQGNIIDPMPRLLYRSFAQWDLRPTTVLAHTSLDAESLLGAMQREVRAVDASLPVTTAKTMTAYLDESLAAPKTAATFLAVLGVFGVCLAGIGLYAVVAFAVSRRTREIGIRMALGARSRQVVWAISRDVGILVLVGTSVGVGLTFLAIQVMQAAAAPAPGITLYRPTADPVALFGIVLFMAIVGLLAGIVPVRRAATLDPLVALRRD